jgi:hypothetical protein
MGVFRYNSTILNLGFTPCPLYLQEKIPRYTFIRRMGGSQLERNLLLLSGIEPRTVKPVAIPTDKFRLLDYLIHMLNILYLKDTIRVL